MTWIKVTLLRICRLTSSCLSLKAKSHPESKTHGNNHLQTQLNLTNTASTQLLPAGALTRAHLHGSIARHGSVCLGEPPSTAAHTRLPALQQQNEGQEAPGESAARFCAGPEAGICTTTGITLKFYQERRCLLLVPDDDTVNQTDKRKQANKR